MTLPDEAQAFVRDCLGERWTAESLAGDASVRAYYRIRKDTGETYMLAWYPEEVRSQLRRFLAAHGALTIPGHLPEVLQHSHAAILQRDVGDRTLFDILHEDRDEGLGLYRDAVDMLVAFQQASAGDINPPFTAAFFRGELDMTLEYYAEKLMGASPEARERLKPYLDTLCKKIASHPYVLCHRDYHGQNIHVVNNTLYLIDFQDLRMGPDTYDLASLLRDRGVAPILGRAGELELIDYYAERAQAQPHLRERYFETLLQRSIKILGTFSKQPILRGRLHYLDFIPPTLESIERCLLELPQFAPLRDLFPMRFTVEAARERALTVKEY
jgi:aminoglycoside/choline kinase family phosphotransferase